MAGLSPRLCLVPGCGERVHSREYLQHLYDEHQDYWARRTIICSRKVDGGNIVVHLIIRIALPASASRPAQPSAIAVRDAEENQPNTNAHQDVVSNTKSTDQVKVSVQDISRHFTQPLTSSELTRKTSALLGTMMEMIEARDKQIRTLLQSDARRAAARESRSEISTSSSANPPSSSMSLPPPIKTRTIQVDTAGLPPTVKPSTSYPHFVDRSRTPTKIDPSSVSIGDITWYPILRPSVYSTTDDISTEFGLISAKYYPVIIVAKEPDSMIGLPISTAGGRGLGSKPDSIRQRSTYVRSGWNLGQTPAIAGSVLKPQCVLTVSGASAYQPLSEAFVDMLDGLVMAYDSRFVKEASLTADSVEALVRMRCSAMARNCGATVD